MMTNVIDLNVFKYRRMWDIERHIFSSKMVRLQMKKGREELSLFEEAELNAINQVVDEHEGQWLEVEDLRERTRNMFKK